MRERKERNLKFIKKRNGQGYWLIDITLNYQRIRRFGGYTKAEALNYLAGLRRAARDGKLDEFLGKAKKTDTFGSYAKTLIESAEWKQKRSWRRDLISLNHLNRFFKDFKLDEINPASVRKYMTERLSQGMAPASINREISLLKSILFRAEYDGIIQSNPIRGRRVKRLEENNSREKIILSMSIDDDKLRRLIEAAPDYFRPILSLAIITGMRQGEILKLRWKDIDFRLGMIRIPAENSKSKKERFIPIDGNLVAMLDSIERRGEFVFTNPGTSERLKNITKVFRSTLKKAGFTAGREKGLTFHDLRHVAAYRLCKQTDVVTASKILGHSSLDMTLRYIHPTDADKRLAIEKSSENLFSGRQNHDSATLGAGFTGETDNDISLLKSIS